MECGMVKKQDFQGSIGVQEYRTSFGLRIRYQSVREYYRPINLWTLNSA